MREIIELKTNLEASCGFILDENVFVAAISLFPAILVANADDKIDNKEKEYIAFLADSYVLYTKDIDENKKEESSDKLINFLAYLSENTEKWERDFVNILQSQIENDFELRVTVIKDECFSAKIESQKLDIEKGAIYWRQGYDNGISFTKTDISQDVEIRCLSFLQHFNLNFGCFDFIVDKNGNYIFLECNTNGQWMWLEEEAKLPISAKIAQIFEDEIKKKR